jgi:hypothetical protein
MSPERFKTTWQQLKLRHSFDRIPEEEILALIAEKPGIHKHRGLLVNLVMLLVFLMVCY